MEVGLIVRHIVTLNRTLTDQQITAMYAPAEKFKVGLRPWGNTPSPARNSFTWSNMGSVFRVVRFRR